MAGILDALRIISSELPKFASEMNVPFSKRQEPQSLMREPSAEQNVNDNERAINETLLSLAPMLLPIMKAMQLAPKTFGAAANAGVAAATGDPTALINGPLGLALSSGDAEAALLPRMYYHGTTKAFEDLKEGLKFFSPSSSVAESYAYGAGGNRGSKKIAGLVDMETDTTYKVLPDSEDGYRRIQAVGKKDSPILEYNPYKEHFIPEGVPEYNGSMLSPEYGEWFAKANPVSKDSLEPIPEGANIRRVALDVDKTIDALFKGYNRDGKSPAIPGLSEIDHQGNRWAKEVLDKAKEGTFDWSTTKYLEAQKAWETIIIPQLQEKGYDSINYWDDMHETMAVFSNKSVKEVPIFKPSEAEKDVAMENVYRTLGYLP